MPLCRFYLLAHALSAAGIVSALTWGGIIRADRYGLTKLLTWGGLRGGLSLALAVSLPDSPWKPLLLNMTYAVVVFSIIVQGLTIGRLFTRIAAAATEGQWFGNGFTPLFSLASAC